jgi:bacteriocin-like protein
MVRAAWMEKIMSNTTTRNSEALREACEPIRELSEAELNTVYGGKVMHGDLQIMKYLDKASPKL